MKSLVHIVFTIVFMLIMSSINAQEKLPKPLQEFKGKIGKTYKDSKEDYPQEMQAPDKAPNIVVIMLDDVGFGQTGTYGGPIPTPYIDKLANNGLSYTRFHTTAICSSS
ncbi:MAG: sulfatase-like hydrolase/transferase, partial [Moheibacter sp.]